jgi:peptide/nickel transport system substrate-binding protein
MAELFNNLTTFSKEIVSGIKSVKKLNLSSLRKVFSLMGKREKILLLALGVVSLLSLVWSLRDLYIRNTVAVPDQGGNYVEGMRGQPLYINPLLAFQDPDLSLTKLIYSGLYKYSPEGELVPDLAESLPEISEDQKQYLIKLKPGIKWHSGRSFTADDVIFTFQIIKDPAYKSPYRGLWQTTAVEKLSDYEVRFTTKDIAAPFLSNLTLPILSKSHWLNTDPEKFHLSELNLAAVGTGPYLVKEITKQQNGRIQSLALEAFSDNYQNTRIKNLTFKFYDSDEDLASALRSGEIMGFGFQSGSEKIDAGMTRSNWQFFSSPLPQYQVLFFNLNNPYLADPAVRQALSQSIDRGQIIDEAFKGQNLLPAPALLFAYSDSSDTHSTTTALNPAQILDQAGWILENGLRTKKTTSLKLNLLTNDSSVNARSAEILAASFRQLGVELEVKVLPTKQLTEENLRTRNFDMLLFSQKYGSDPDPFVFWHSSQIKDPGLNLSGLQDGAVDKLITEARTTTNPEVRKEKYLALEKQLSQLLPAINLTESQYFYYLDKSIKNIHLGKLYDPSYRFYDLPNWYIDEKRVWQ